MSSRIGGLLKRVLVTGAAGFVGACARFAEQRFPLAARQPVVVPVGARVLAAVVEEADIVVLLLERLDLPVDEGVELAQVGRDLRGNVEIHGVSSG